MLGRSGCCAVVRGPPIHCSVARRTASATRRTPGTTTSGSVLCGLRNPINYYTCTLYSLSLYLVPVAPEARSKFIAPMENQSELPVIQRMYDLMLWYVPRLNKFPRDHKFMLGDRIQHQLHVLLEGLIRARYLSDKIGVLESLNVELEVLRFQTRLAKDFELLDVRRYEHASKLINEIGENLGGWLRQQRRKR